MDLHIPVEFPKIVFMTASLIALHPGESCKDSEKIFGHSTYSSHFGHILVHMELPPQGRGLQRLIKGAGLPLSSFRATPA